MELTSLSFIIASALGLTGLLGWSHKSIKSRLNQIEIELYKRPSFAEVRRTVEDKMSPFRVEYLSLSRRIDEVKTDQHKLNDKLDRLLVICSQIAHKE
jgi:hypothetical protein